MLVGSIVVKDQMQIQIWRKLTVQSPHESQELLMAMVRHALSHHGPRENIQDSE
jgi:hypothetical protein